MDKTWIALCCLTIIPLALFFMFPHNPPTVADDTQERLIGESIKMQDQIRTQSNLNVILEESISLSDSMKVTKP